MHRASSLEAENSAAYSGSASLLRCPKQANTVAKQYNGAARFGKAFLNGKNCVKREWLRKKPDGHETRPAVEDFCCRS